MNIIYYVSPINLIFILLFLVYTFDIKNQKLEKYDNITIYDIINIYLLVILIITLLIIIENIILKKII
jgi:hypothetical protein